MLFIVSDGTRLGGVASRGDLKYEEMNKYFKIKIKRRLNLMLKSERYFSSYIIGCYLVADLLYKLLPDN